MPAEREPQSETAAVSAVSTSNATPTPTLDRAQRSVSRTLRPEGMEEAPSTVAATSVTEEPAQQPDPEEAGMSRLMAAKLRARQRQNPEDEG